MKLEEVFASAQAEEASDIVLSPGSRVSLRVEGHFKHLETGELSADHVWSVLRGILPPDALARFEKVHDLELAITHAGKRYRATAYFRDGQPAVALRTIPDKVRSPKELGIPHAVMALSERPHGLMLFSGPAGQGKTTSMNSVIDQMNHGVARHIVTIEDPVEFVHKSQSCIIDQREIGRDTESFEVGLLHMMRQTPDVIVISEMRDPLTMRAALTLAETGHLVLSTIHTSDAPQALDRIIDAFPVEGRPLVRMQLSLALIGVVAQRLVVNKNGKRVLACEVLANTAAVAGLLREGKTEQLYSVLELEQQHGMQSMNQALQRLVEQNIIEPSMAARYSIAHESKARTTR